MLTANNNNKTSLSERKMRTKFPWMASLYDHCLWPATEANLSWVFSQFFSNLWLPVYLNPMDNQHRASINSQTSNFLFPQKFFIVCYQPWMKLIAVKNIDSNCTTTWNISKSECRFVWMIWKPSGNLNYLLKARDIICNLKSRDGGQQYI